MHTNGHHWFDAHLDLAYLAEGGRDMHAPLDDCRGRLHPASITLPSLADGRVRRCLATVFTEAVHDPSAPDAETGPWAYPAGNVEAARKAGLRQLKLYQAWQSAGVVRPFNDTGEGPLALGVLVEGADPIENPDAVPEWVAGGVVAVGLAWSAGTRYAGGNGQESIGLTDAGRDLVAALDEHRIVHDLTHLSQRAVDDLLAHTAGPIVATHANCRSLMGGEGTPGWQRHLADDTIREIVRRDGVIGTVLYSGFLAPNQHAARGTIDQVCAHIEHVCELAGDRAHVGLGSDMDGGFGADCLPTGIDTPADLVRILEALAARGWSDDDLAGFAHANWDRYWAVR